MTVRNLEHLFHPSSVAVIGASQHPDRVGGVVIRNLLTGGFDGPIMPVNPKYEAVAGVLAYPDIKTLPVVPDLAVICTPPASVPGLIQDLHDRGNRAAVVLTAGLERSQGADGRTLEQAMLDAARPEGMRILGPNSVGLLAPRIGLNASFAQTHAQPGRLAFISQSGALCTAVLDWAQAADIGFSCFASLGNAADLDFGDAIDYLGSDPDTRAILLYIESIQHGRKFISAARAASRNKPIVAIKAGRVQEGIQAAASHTGALAGSDEVMDYALRRAGVLRVDEIDDLFNTVETLARSPRLKGDRLLILTNGGGPGVMAADALVAGGGRLASLSPETIARLDAVLPANWSHGNPVDIIGDAPPARFRAAMEILDQAPDIDAILVLFAPTALARADATAQAVVEAAKAGHRAVFTSFLGRASAESARQILVNAGVPTYDTPGDAVGAFLHMEHYRRSRELLAQTPDSVTTEFDTDPGAARGIIEAALAEEREWLSAPEAEQVLAAYGIPTTKTRIVRDPQEAVAAAEAVGLPVAVKVLSPQVLHKSDVGGVRLDLETPEAVLDAVEAMAARIRRLQPDAEIEGFAIQRMARRPGAYELLAGAAVDPLFGPFLMFGHGGTAVEVLADEAVALPPLNTVLARDLMSRTRVWKLLQGFRNERAADIDAIARVLIQLSHVLVDLPEIIELDINPLLADHAGVLALDEPIRVRKAGVESQRRLAIRPYPTELEERWKLNDKLEVLVRPIRPEDEQSHAEFFTHVTPEDMTFRFFSRISEMPHNQLARFTQIDYDREMAFVAKDAAQNTLGVVRAVTDPDNAVAEFAIIVRSDIKGQGLGKRLLEKMIEYCRGRGTPLFAGQVLRNNTRMLALARSLGFEVDAADRDAGEVNVRLWLQQDPAAAAEPSAHPAGQA